MLINICMTVITSPSGLNLCDKCSFTQLTSSTLNVSSVCVMPSTLPTYTISMSNINTELSRASTSQICLNESALRSLSGCLGDRCTISMYDFRGKTARVNITVNLASTWQYNNYFNICCLSGYCAGKTNITVCVPTSTVVGGGWGLINMPAFSIGCFATGDCIVIYNSGYIVGVGGFGAFTNFYGSCCKGMAAIEVCPVSGAGAYQPVVIYNYGKIWGGGGGGATACACGCAGAGGGGGAGGGIQPSPNFGFTMGGNGGGGWSARSRSDYTTSFGGGSACGPGQVGNDGADKAPFYYYAGGSGGGGGSCGYAAFGGAATAGGCWCTGHGCGGAAGGSGGGYTGYTVFDRAQGGQGGGYNGAAGNGYGVGSYPGSAGGGGFFGASGGSSQCGPGGPGGAAVCVRHGTSLIWGCQGCTFGGVVC